MDNIYADDIQIGQKVRFQPYLPYSRAAYEGIVVGISRDMGEDDPISRITFDLWDWDGIEDVTVWESEPATIL